jgi:hypothetical protein
MSRSTRMVLPQRPPFRLIQDRNSAEANDIRNPQKLWIGGRSSTSTRCCVRSTATPNKVPAMGIQSATVAAAIDAIGDDAWTPVK